MHIFWQNSETIHYFEFADKFVDSKLIPDDWEEQLRTMMYELVGDAVNYYDILDEWKLNWPIVN